MTQHETVSDTELMTFLSRGDHAALGELARRYEGSLLGLARGLLSGRHDLADDAVQESWVRVLRFRSTFNGTSSVKTWLYRIVINQCHTMRAMTRTVGAHRHSDPATSKAPAITVDTDRSCDLMRALNGLPDEKRTVVLLCYHRGMTHEQAADIMEIPIGTLKSRLHSALEYLRNELTDCEITS